jgi:hypothetical protein
MNRGWVSLLGLGLLGLACDRPPVSDPSALSETGIGQLRLRLQAKGFEGLASLRVRIINPDAGDPCAFARAITEKILPVTGSTVETTFVLPAERWAACLQPLDQYGNEMRHCSGQIGFIPVPPNQTVEVSGTVNCRPLVPGGAAHVAVGFNHVPVIETIDIQPGLSITTCDTAALTVTASDVDGDDPLHYLWHVSTPPGLPAPVFGFQGPVGSFRAYVAGSYGVSVTPHDGKGIGAFLGLSLQVTEASCR